MAAALSQCGFRGWPVADIVNQTMTAVAAVLLSRTRRAAA